MIINNSYLLSHLPQGISSWNVALSPMRIHLQLSSSNGLDPLIKKFGLKLRAVKGRCSLVFRSAKELSVNKLNDASSV